MILFFCSSNMLRVLSQVHSMVGLNLSLLKQKILLLLILEGQVIHMWGYSMEAWRREQRYVVWFMPCCCFCWMLQHYNHLPTVPCIAFQVMYKTLNPQWNQTLEFPDDGSPLELHVKDYNALLPTYSIGDCVVEYQGLPPNQTSDKWIPLQGVTRGEIHVRITRKVPELQTRSSLEADASLTKSHQISNQVMIMCYRMIIMYTTPPLDQSIWHSQALYFV